MGMESFYINIKTEVGEKEFIKKELEQKAEYQKGLMLIESETETSIIGSTFSFIPACCLIYKLCMDISKRKANFVFNTYGEDRIFNFDSKAEFIGFMYSKWETKLDGVAEQLGVFLVNPSKAYKVQRKIGKKYYTKFKI